MAKLHQETYQVSFARASNRSFKIVSPDVYVYVLAYLKDSLKQVGTDKTFNTTFSNGSRHWVGR